MRLSSSRSRSRARSSSSPPRRCAARRETCATARRASTAGCAVGESGHALHRDLPAQDPLPGGRARESFSDLARHFQARVPEQRAWVEQVGGDDSLVRQSRVECPVGARAQAGEDEARPQARAARDRRARRAPGRRAPERRAGPSRRIGWCRRRRRRSPRDRVATWERPAQPTAEPSRPTCGWVRSAGWRRR